MAFYDFFAWANAEIKILKIINHPTPLGFLFFFFFRFSIFSFSYLFAAVVGLQPDLLSVQEFQRTRKPDRKFLLTMD